MLPLGLVVLGFYYPIVPKAQFVHCQLEPLGRATADFFFKKVVALPTGTLTLI